MSSGVVFCPRGSRQKCGCFEDEFLLVQGLSRLSAGLSARTDPDPSCCLAPLANSSTLGDSATKTVMAPRLAPSQLVMIRDMIESRSLTTSEMAEAAGCSKRSIITISNNSECSAMFEHP